MGFYEALDRQVVNSEKNSLVAYASIVFDIFQGFTHYFL